MVVVEVINSAWASCQISYSIVFCKSSLLTCLLKEPQTCLTGLRGGDLLVCQTEQGDTIPVIKSSNFNQQSKLFLRNMTKASSPSSTLGLILTS